MNAALADADPADPLLRAAAEAARPPVTLLAALARADLAAGEVAAAAALLSRALARDANHLHLQALHRRAIGRCRPAGPGRPILLGAVESLETAPGGQAYFAARPGCRPRSGP